MTYDEAKICMEHGILVTVIRKMNNQEYLDGNNYFDLQSETVPLDAIKVANSFSNFAGQLIRDGKISQFKSLIEELMAAGLNQTQVTDRVKKIYKQLKTQQR